MSHTTFMITFISIAAPLALIAGFGAFSARYGAETRPGFDESAPLS